MARGADRIDYRLVERMRAQGASWAACAKANAVTEDTLRTHCDPKYTAPDLAAAAERTPKLASGRENRPGLWAEPVPIEQRPIPPCSNAKTLKPEELIVTPPANTLPAKNWSAPATRMPDIGPMPTALAVARAVVAAAKVLGQDPTRLFNEVCAERQMRFPALAALQARYPDAPLSALGRMTGVLTAPKHALIQARGARWWTGGGAGDAALEAALDALDLHALEAAEG